MGRLFISVELGKDIFSPSPPELEIQRRLAREPLLRLYSFGWLAGCEPE